VINKQGHMLAKKHIRVKSNDFTALGGTKKSERRRISKVLVEIE